MRTHEYRTGDSDGALSIDFRAFAQSSTGGHVALDISLLAFKERDDLFCCSDTTLQIDEAFDATGALANPVRSAFPGAYSCQYDSVADALSVRCPSSY